jgi:DNA polymerase/3'-5' exonuclease PolX
MDYKDNIINTLTILKNNSNDNIFHVRAYDKVITNIKKIKEPILSLKQVENIEGVGTKIKSKLQDIFNNSLSYSIDNDIKNNLLNVYGIGESKAKSLIDEHNIKSIDELRTKCDKLLTKAQKIGLLCYEDLLLRIPRSEMKKHQKILNLSKDKGEIVGSFRRKEETSGDIDVMLNMNSSEFKKYTEGLVKSGYIKYILAEGDKKMLAICKLNNQEDSKYRRIDLIRNTKEEYPFMKLYFTGPKEFNISFRNHCLSLGLSLNERSFKPYVENIKTEEDIFKHVGLEYVEPEDRK